MTNGLPKGWKWTTCGELAAHEPNAIMDGPFGSKLKTEHYTNNGARVIRLGNIQPLLFVDENKAFISMKYYRELRAHEARPGDLLIAALGEPLGRTCRVPGNLGPAIVKADCLRYRPAEAIDADYLVYWLNSPRGRISIDTLSHGIGRKRINTQDLRRVPVPVAPIGQQRIIVAELNSLLETSRTAREELARIPRLLERYKHTFLTAALRGDVTGDDSAKWPTLNLGDLIDGIDSGKNIRCDERPPARSERGIVKVSSVSWGTFDPLAAKTPRSGATLNPRSLISSGDFLISRANTLELVGACVVVGPLADNNLYLSDKVLRIRFSQRVESWVLYYLRSKEGREQIESLSTGNQLSMRNISQAAIKAIRIPLPLEEVRNRILSCVERAFTATSSTLEETERATDLLVRLEQAILAKAFRGELVEPQRTVETEMAVSH